MSPSPDAFTMAGPPDKTSAGIHKFTHNSMGAVFEIRMAHDDGEYARHASAAAFAELDRLNEELSRFISHSDISQINTLRAWHTTRVGEATMECIVAAARVWSDTGGAFDPTIGRLFALWRPADGSEPHPTDEQIAAARQSTGMDKIAASERELLIGVRCDGLLMDLGGIGKGYAIDRMIEILKEWSIENALVHGGWSSLMAIGSAPGGDGWSIRIRDPEKGGEGFGSVRIKNFAISGSASPARNRHIIDPRIGRPATANLGAWSAHPSATISDALSTAFFITKPDDVNRYCTEHAEASAMLLVPDSSGRTLKRFGKWDSFYEPRA